MWQIIGQKNDKISGIQPTVIEILGQTKKKRNGFFSNVPLQLSELKCVEFRSICKPSAIKISRARCKKKFISTTKNVNKITRINS